MKEHLEQIEETVTRVRHAADLVRPIAEQFSDDSFLSISPSCVCLYHATREDFALMKSLAHGCVWRKHDPGDGEMRYTTDLKIDGNYIMLTVDCCELPPSCRIEWTEEHVPAQTKRVAKVICT